MVRVFLGGLKGILLVYWVLVGCSEWSPGCCYGVLNGCHGVGVLYGILRGHQGVARVF